MKLVTGGFNQGLGENKIDLKVSTAYGIDDPMLLTAFETNLYRFSAGKTLIELQELNSIFRKSNSFAQYERLAKQVTDTFNRKWARTEYNTAILSGEATATYYRLLAKTEEFPYWEYKTVGDDNVRHQHALLDGLILPANSPIWQKLFPPNDWNCRCFIVPRLAAEVKDIDLAAMQARANAYFETPEYKRAQAQGWAVNRADLGEVFNINQQYISKQPGKAHKKLNALKASDYGLRSYSQAKKVATDDAPDYQGTDREYLNTLEVINQARIMSDYNNRAHQINSIPKNSLALTLAAQETLLNPDELWLNATKLEAAPDRFVFIKYYLDRTVVVIGTQKGNTRRIKRWFTLTEKAGVINTYRRGLLIKG